MGEKKCNFEDLNSFFNDEDKAPGTTEPLTDEQMELGRSLMARGVALTALRATCFPDALVVLYKRDTDISDPEEFPDTYDDKPVVYVDTPPSILDY